METINPKSMFTKGQTAYSIALLSYKDDETEKIITHTISKVGRSFVYDEKETKYHYSNKYKAFISADAFHHQQANLSNRESRTGIPGAQQIIF